MSVGQRCGMVSKEEGLSVRRQCVLLGLCRATWCARRHLHRTPVAQREAGVRVREPLPYFRLLQQPPPAPKPWLPVSRDGLHEETGGMILMIGIMDIPDKDTFFH